jgi:hypothetical protein
MQLARPGKFRSKFPSRTAQEAHSYFKRSFIAEGVIDVVLCKDVWGGTCRRRVVPPEYKCGVDHKMRSSGVVPSNREILELAEPNAVKQSLVEKILAYKDEELIIEIAQSQIVSEPEILNELGKNHSYKVREAVARNPSVFSSYLLAEGLARDPAFSVRKALASNKSINKSEAISYRLSQDSNTSVKKALVGNGSIIYMKDTLEALAQDVDPSVSKEVAWLGDIGHFKWMILDISGSKEFHHEMLNRIINRSTPLLTAGVVSLAISKTRAITHEEAIALIKRYDGPALRATLSIVDFEINLI